MHVYILNTDITTSDGDWGGYTTAHHTLKGALAELDSQLTRASIDVEAAHYGVTVTETSWCNDPDPDTLDGAIVTWGINRTEVRQ